MTHRQTGMLLTYHGAKSSLNNFRIDMSNIFVHLFSDLSGVDRKGIFYVCTNQLPNRRERQSKASG